MADVVHGSPELCGPYLLGGLDPQSEAEFERHLGGCRECLDACDEFGPLVSAMGHLPLPDIRAALGVTATAPEPAAGQRQRGTGRRGLRSLLHPTRHGRRTLAGVLALAVAVTVATIGGLRLLDPEPPASVSPITVSATGGDSRAAVRLEAAISVHGDDVRVEATVTGLRPALDYEMYAVTTDGDTHLLRRWNGAGSSQEVVGELRVRVEDLAFVSIVESGGIPVVVARLTGRSASPEPDPSR
jgi:hypothetical protein